MVLLKHLIDFTKDFSCLDSSRDRCLNVAYFEQCLKGSTRHLDKKLIWRPRLVPDKKLLWRPRQTGLELLKLWPTLGLNFKVAFCSCFQLGSQLSNLKFCGAQAGFTLGLWSSLQNGFSASSLLSIQERAQLLHMAVNKVELGWVDQPIWIDVVINKVGSVNCERPAPVWYSALPTMWGCAIHWEVLYIVLFQVPPIYLQCHSMLIWFQSSSSTPNLINTLYIQLYIWADGEGWCHLWYHYSTLHAGNWWGFVLMWRALNGVLICL